MVRYRLTRITINEEIFALEVEQEPSKNNKSKVKDSSLEKNNYLPKIFNKVSDQAPEKVKENKVLKKETNQKNNQNG
ncbi:13884_t:CDS:2 [Gigaspora margarita]|uniref:13884_t:CDS:1 n=1 Tax=Gigaspora margarita TaxID=4874 RepID=A0ABN7V459_GIGMA|nr:13884_t:CDS:2 [Gigaspora margarita]